jgi:GTP cyclohydrolase IA
MSFMSIEQQEKIAEFIRHCGDDPTREGMANTPQRHLKAMEFLTSGYKMSLPEVINGALFASDISDMVIVRDIEFYSLCEHHLLPFMGKCHIGYIPNGKVLGLSKFGRVVDMFAHRFQIQEGLSKQIADAIYSVTQASGVGVIIEAKHTCMMMRGIQKQHSCMATSVMLGSFRDNQDTRNEFLNLVRG